MMDKITSKIYHLDRAKLYETEKPFNWSAELACLPGLPGSNHVFTSQTVNINDVRGCTPPSLDTQGFEFVKSTTSLKPEDFDNDNLIQTTFYSEIEKVLFEQLPDVTAVAFLGHQVRTLNSQSTEAEHCLHLLLGPEAQYQISAGRGCSGSCCPAANNGTRRSHNARRQGSSTGLFQRQPGARKEAMADAQVRTNRLKGT